jgi:RHS repeat-associated protein
VLIARRFDQALVVGLCSLMTGWPILETPHKTAADRALSARICDSTGTFSVTVNPPSGSATWGPVTSGHTAAFTVQNTGLCQDTYMFTPAATGPVYGISLSPTGATLRPGFSTTVTVTYSVGATGSGFVEVTATGDFGTNNTGYYPVSVTSNGPVVSLAPNNGDYRDVSKCVENCFDAVASYATPPYFSANMPHSVQLVYRSAQAHAMGFVQVDATDTSSVSPAKMSLQLQRLDGTSVRFTNDSTEMFYQWAAHAADGNVNRLAAQFDADTVSTGAYTYKVAVRSYRSDGSFRENDALIRVLVLNEKTSVFGAGWSIAGFQHGYLQADSSIVIREGNGSIAYFTPGTTSCNGGICTKPYSSPKGDFTTFWKSTGGTCITPPCPTYQRAYPGGSTVGFDANLNIIALGGFRYVGKNPRSVHYGMSMDDIRALPTVIMYFGRATFGYNASGLLVAIMDSAGKGDSLGYDANNHLRWIKDPGGRVDTITIDGSGNLAKIKDWAQDSVQFQYDSYHRLVHWTDRRGGAWGLAYDFAGKLATDTAPQVTANGQSVRPVRTHASVEQNVLINPATGRGTSSNPGPNVDTAAVRAAFTNARGYTSTYALDRFGAANLVQEPLGRTTSFTRDSNSAIVRTVSPSGHVMKYTWSGPDLTKTVDSTTTRTINYAYTAHHGSLVSGDVDSLVSHWTIGSSQGDRLDSTHAGGAGWTKFTYKSDGRLCGVTDPGNHPSTCYFTSTSGFQNTDSITYQLGTVRYRYDGHGQLVTFIDQVGDTTRFHYDSIGRQTAIIGPLHDSTSLGYDGLYLTQVGNAKLHVYKYWPNALGWVDSTTDLAGKVDHYRYDLNGNRTSWTNRNGRTITYAYDSLDQIRSVVADGKTATFFFDPAKHYVVTSDSESVDTLRFDSADRPRLTISCRVLASGNAPQCFRDSSAYEIRDVDTLATLSAPSWGSAQFLVGHHYDVHQLLDTLTPGHLNTQTGQPITFVYSAEALDSIRTVTGLNNLTITHSYPWTHRTDQVQLSDPTLTATLGTAYNFDNAGRLAIRYHGSLANPDTTRTVSYDAPGNLVWYADSSHQSVTSCFFVCGGYHCTSSTQASFVDSTRYTFDSVGNRKDPSAPNGGLDSANHLRRWQNLRMDYDAAGNMTAKRTLSWTDTTKILRTDSLFWSALGRLDSVRTRDSSNTLTGRVGFGYDGWGRRVRKSTANFTGRYLWDGHALLALLDTLGNGVAAYTYYPGMDNVASVLRHDHGDSSYYYVQDYSRNVLALLAQTSAGVKIDNQYRYDPFGNVQGNASDTIPNSLQFAGREYDTETQLYYDRARYIDPAVGRFVSEDPIGLNGGNNLYTLVGNDPVNGSDPSGNLRDNIEVELCGGYQEPLHDAAEHLIIGYGFVRSANWLHKWLHLTPVEAGLAAGIIHEGPWWDGDLTRSQGAPCNGEVDTFLFMIVPLVSSGWSGPGVVSTQYPQVPHAPADVQGGSPIPGFPGFPGVPGVVLPPDMPYLPPGLVL